MSVSIFANALRAHSRLRLTATRVTLPATRGISSFRTAVPKNVSLSVSRSFTTSQLARNDASRVTGNFSVFVANIPWDTTEDGLAQVFSKFGQIIGVRIRSDGRVRPWVGHVGFASKDSAVSAAQEPIHLAGNDLHVEFRMIEPNEKLLFTGSSVRDESVIRTIFKQFSDSIINIELSKSSPNAERTAGFVHFNSVESATDALKALEGTQTPDGESLALCYNRPRKASKFKSSER